MEKSFEAQFNKPENKDEKLEQLFHLSKQLAGMNRAANTFVPDEDGYYKAGIDFNRAINNLEQKYEKQLSTTGLELDMYLGDRYFRRGIEEVDKNQSFGSVLFTIKNKDAFLAQMDYVLHNPKKSNTQVELIDHILQDISTALREQYSFTEDTIFELLALSKEIKKRIQTEIDFEEVFYVEDFVQDMEFVEHAMKQECIRDVSFALLHRLHAENSNFSSYIKHYYDTDSVDYLQDVFKEDLAFIEQLIKERKASFFIPQLLRNFNTKRNAENETIKLLLQDKTVNKEKILPIKNIIEDSLQKSNQLLNLYA